MITLEPPSGWVESSLRREQRVVVDGPASVSSKAQSGDDGEDGANGGVCRLAGAATEIGELGDAGDGERLVAVSSGCR